MTTSAPSFHRRLIMIVFRSFVVRTFCCIALPLAVASGQRNSIPTLDLGAEIWGGRASGRVFGQDGGFATTGLLSWRVRSMPHGAFVVGGGLGAQAIVGGGDKCLITPSGCAPDYPEFSWVTAHVGAEGHLGGTGRVLAGP